MGEVIVPMIIGAGVGAGVAGAMGGSPPKPIAPPEIKPLAPIPTQDTGAGDAEKRRLLRKRGRRETFLTGDLVPEDTGKKKLLG